MWKPHINGRRKLGSKIPALLVGGSNSVFHKYKYVSDFEAFMTSYLYQKQGHTIYFKSFCLNFYIPWISCWFRPSLFSCLYSPTFGKIFFQQNKWDYKWLCMHVLMCVWMCLFERKIYTNNAHLTHVPLILECFL